MTTTVYFVRHGSHDRLGKILCGRMDGVNLSAQGRAEAQALAERLRRQPIAAVYASPLPRARQTAEPIAGALGLPLRTAEPLNEIDYGDWTGAAFEALDGDPAWARWNVARCEARPPNGESMTEVQARVAGWLEAARAEHPAQHVVAVCHGDVVKAALAHALDLCLDRHDRFEVGPASISVVAAGDWGLKVHSVNEAAR